MTPQPDLSVIIPTWNDSETITDLVTAFLQTPDLCVQVVVVDDASTDDTVARLREVEAPGLVILQQETNAGAGVARNVGFDVATGRYTLFFDGDDEVDTETLAKTVRLLDRTNADAAVLAYRYRRGQVSEYEGMNSFDNAVWGQYLDSTQRVCRLDEVPRLLGSSNYPWNKVIRTERYREVGLRFGDTMVNNDILGHWMTLLFARKLVLMDDVLCTHIVNEGGKNLTNRKSRVRLTLFDALDSTYSMLEEHPDLRNRFAHHYWDFVLRVTSWAEGRVPPEAKPEFSQRLQRHLLRADIADYTRIRSVRSPGLAERMFRRAMA